MCTLQVMLCIFFFYFFLFFFFFLSFEIGSHCIAQASLKPAIFLPQPPQCRDYRFVPLYPDWIFYSLLSFPFLLPLPFPSPLLSSPLSSPLLISPPLPPWGLSHARQVFCYWATSPAPCCLFSVVAYGGHFKSDCINITDVTLMDGCM
jgi:hypothetical protein